ncbi:MAG: hypothetical protein AVDCRST_MAG19-2224 [uncultured Thermomicrobiales bacterium]|uniref:Uncharacterized protein n=1 Tax=uncultured Thermomicrobiales bacterium TaxID=1645740 RepID=A0A6J4V2S9_9BACT|nr:MAG: hypothetical protein AVDCRST_MAG19-2224 [uncultured Thermomicrobiales bacterium]
MGRRANARTESPSPIALSESSESRRNAATATIPCSRQKPATTSDSGAPVQSGLTVTSVFTSFQRSPLAQEATRTKDAQPPVSIAQMPARLLPPSRSAARYPA